MALERELATFQRELPRLLADPASRGKYALVHGDQIHGLYDTVDEGLAAGYQQFGLEPFLVQEVNDHPQPKFFSRNVTRCRS